MPGTHALLSPSSSHRWLNCTASPLLEAKVPNVDTDFTKVGTLAHACCSFKLKSLLSLPLGAEGEEMTELRDYYTGEMDEHTETYVNIILDKLGDAKKSTKDAQLLVETRLDFSKYIPDSYGTADAIIIADGLMEVIDFKYGKGVAVDANENSQMMIYALGAYEAFSFEYNIKRVRMTIVQPRLANLSEYELDTKDLLLWAETVLTPKSKEAASGKGQQKAGDWCRFCRVKATCKAMAALAEDTCKDTDPKLLTPEEIAVNILPRMDAIKSWLTSVEEYTLQQALDGTRYPGYKLVEGRSVRKIADADAMLKALTDSGCKEEDVMRAPELRTLTDLEKLVGKKKLADIGGELIVKPAGKPTLVPESDKRPALNSAEEDFKGIN